ncbi:hypothetical protein IBC87_00380 [Bifidobacterium adolescentis]|jgi:hypothetical protein|uniref:hypothetical protein n=1 Tax=Bifidobacterium adolescentis TaxID=1680 RepID=UPI0018DC37B4|nr:hypothetical protein [Bifidobacterium adolescentis]MBH8620609.1 hypothetical protein [Bifidobacterium adolescentis]
MTDNNTKRKVRSLKAVKAKYLESHPKIEEWIKFTVDDKPDAKEFRIHAPIFQSNEEKKAFAKARDDDDDFEMVQALLGDQWEDFIGEGGQVSILLLLLNDWVDEVNGVDSEGNPTTL